MKLKPLFARVLLERERPERFGRILVPRSAQIRNAPCKGTVIAKGPNADASIDIGAAYIFGPHAGAWVNSKGLPAANEEEQHFFVCQDEDLICAIEEEDQA